MTLNVQHALYCRKDASFGAHYTNLNYQRHQCWPMSNDCSFLNCAARVIFGGDRRDHVAYSITKVDIVVLYDNNPFWISADTNKDDLE